jgi:hypothetical protein
VTTEVVLDKQFLILFICTQKSCVATSTAWKWLLKNSVLPEQTNMK